MDLRSEVESHQFLWYFGKPFKEMCCNLFSLKTGVTIIAIIDIVVGVLRIFDLVSLIGAMSAFYIPTAFAIFVILWDSITIGTFVFAVVGLRGLSKLNPDNVRKYSLYKHLELLAVATIFGLVCILFCDEIFDDCFSPGVFIVWALHVLVDAYATKIVWSADIRLRYNESVLVMHGQQVVQLMQQQARNLAPEVQMVAMPGQPIYQMPIGQPVYSR
jgi:hypothetical protein